MALQSGIGVSKILIIAGAAGYTSTILLKNGKLADILGDLQSWVKGLEKQSDGDSEYGDAITTQVRRLAMEVRQLASARQITVLNGNSGGNLTALVIPAATLGALGYGYMWWKGFSFSDLMYVTKRNMSAAVSNLTKHLENVSDALSKAKEHLTQRIEGLDDKMELQNKISKEIRDSVSDANSNISRIEYDLEDLQKMVSGLDGKIDKLEYKQDVANIGVLYLCNFVDGKRGKMPDVLKDQLKLSGKTRGLLTHPETPSLQGLKEIADTLSGNNSRSAFDFVVQDGIDNVDYKPRALLRASSARC
ncbi:DUF1664 domain-containing protein [Cephalotus follicularis]|uniref:DUF1664 domain-containing protein n=1 Tax=Cephalotus follicularis TaxID=3775 RepID=A0A1Q3CXR7_CEPFO|nr:DUF1664 domain-containing protein [Cephalotus follicularis]